MSLQCLFNFSHSSMFTKETITLLDGVLYWRISARLQGLLSQWKYSSSWTNFFRMATGFLYLHFMSILYPFYICVFMPFSNTVKFNSFAKSSFLLKWFANLLLCGRFKWSHLFWNCFGKGFSLFPMWTLLCIRYCLGLKDRGRIRKKMNTKK